MQGNSLHPKETESFSFESSIMATEKSPRSYLQEGYVHEIFFQRNIAFYLFAEMAFVEIA